MTELPPIPPTGPTSAGTVAPRLTPGASQGPSAAGTAPAAPPPKKSSGVWKVLVALLLLGSLAVNAVLVVALLGIVGMTDMEGLFSGGGFEETYIERVVEKGPGSKKIAIIRIDGVVDEMMAESVRAEAERAARDDAVKAVILRINSPGGGLTASDMIHHDLKTLLGDKPLIASMDAVAASGGYYIACAADDIVAQQTTITGSIGVIAQFFFLNGLLQDKLGIVPVTLKVGQHKDWPNMFAASMTEEQKEYFLKSLLQPGYDRFVDVVTESRGLKREDVLALATGRIFMAREAKENGLVDEIGYLEDAIKVAKKRAGIQEARIVEYVRPFRLFDILGASARTQTLLDLRPEKLAALASPKIMYLWTGY
jgi:protease-4